MTPTYKPSDRVRIKPLEELKLIKEYDPGMDKFAGTTHEIWRAALEEYRDSLNATKLPPQQQPEPVDRERLERFVLAAMAGESCATYRGTDDEWTTHILNYANRMMKAVDNYKPDSK